MTRELILRRMAARKARHEVKRRRIREAKRRQEVERRNALGRSRQFAIDRAVAEAEANWRKKNPNASQGALARVTQRIRRLFQP